MYIYTFFKKKSNGKISIASPTYLEAIVLVLKELNPMYKEEYDLRNYHLGTIIDKDKYCQILNIDEFYYPVPRIISNEEYKKILGKDVPDKKNNYESLDKYLEETEEEIAKA